MQSAPENKEKITGQKVNETDSVTVCTYCVMDSSDPDIEFDAKGVCNHCRNALELLKSEPYSLTLKERQKRLNELVEQIKLDGKGKRFDCIIGVSGGVDSTYAAYQVKKLGLRPLAVHLDNGWNSELAQKNVENILKTLGIDLFTYVIDWPEFRDLQLAFLRASTPDTEIVTDHAVVSIMFETASKYEVKYILAGTNLSTESILPAAWSQGHNDWKYISSIHRKFGSRSLKTFPHQSFLKGGFRRWVKGIRFISILDYFDYVKEDAVQILEKEAGWRNYGGKHHESLWTKFFQAYLLPTKFNFDKRKAHLSSLICAGQLSREEAIVELKKDIYDPEQLRDDREYVISKFGINETEFSEIMNAGAKSYWNYPSYEKSWYVPLVRRLAKIIRGGGK